MIDNKLLEALNIIGLTQKQAEVYLACLELGTAQVGKIADKTGEKRTTVYSILQDLVRHGLLKSNKSGNKYLFSPEKPTELVDQMEEKKEKIKSIIPLLNEKFLNKSIEPKLEIFYGKKIIKLFDKILQCKNKELLMIRSNANKSEIIGKEFHFGKNRQEKKIFAKVLLQRETNKLKKDRQYFANQQERLREVRLLPAEINVPSDVFIFDNSMAIISPNEKSGFYLENKDFVDLQKSIFNTLWQISKPTFNI